mmetsp:Transcript_29228/g.84644  ORF Transcript_29228/g.84644 Transcript_29228/m.84644 type:complete len:325 (+) Transcript_29228:3026-4000(+)
MRELRGVLTPTAGAEPQPRRAHDALLREEPLCLRCLRAEDVREALPRHVPVRHLTRRIQDDLEERQFAVAILQRLLECVIPVLEFRPELLHAGALLVAQAVELELRLAGGLLHCGVVVQVVHVQQQVHATFHPLDDKATTLISLPCDADLAEEVEAWGAGPVVLESVQEEKPQAPVLLEQQAPAGLRCLRSGVTNRACVVEGGIDGHALAHAALQPSAHLGGAGSFWPHDMVALARLALNLALDLASGLHDGAHVIRRLGLYLRGDANSGRIALAQFALDSRRRQWFIHHRHRDVIILLGGDLLARSRGANSGVGLALPILRTL